MTRNLLLAATALGLIGSTASVSAQGVYVNGVYTESGQTITIPATGNVNIGNAPTFGTEYNAPTTGGQYQVTNDGYIAEGQTYAAPSSTQSYTVPAGQSGTYNIVVPSAPAATHSTPVVNTVPIPAETRASGWAARGVYVGARASVNLTRGTEFTIDNAVDGRNAKVDSEYDDPGFGGSLVVGYGARSAGWGYRVEVEGGYQTADVDRHRIQGLGTYTDAAEGDAKVLYGFVNVYGDLPITERLALTAGGGVGAGRVTLDEYGVRGVGQVLDDDGVAFGYHLDAGVSYQVTDSVAIEAMYRYQQFVDAELETENGNKEDVDLSSHNFIAGVRVGF